MLLTWSFMSFGLWINFFFYEFLKKNMQVNHELKKNYFEFSIKCQIFYIIFYYLTTLNKSKYSKIMMTK